MAGSLVGSGTFLSVSGYYSTNLTGSTDLEAIVAPDGWIYFSSPNHGGGGRAEIAAYGQAVTENSLGHSISMFTLNQNATLNLTGSTQGNYTLTREDSLPTTPVLGAAELNLANGQFIFSATGLSVGSTNILQACADLNSANWVSVATNVATGGTGSFTNAVVASRQFFRLVQLQ
jgi:hypothetical protein